MKRSFFILFSISLLFVGCQSKQLILTSPGQFIGSTYRVEVIPYNQKANEELHYDNYFMEQEFNTAFEIRVQNLSSIPFKSRIQDSATIIDDQNTQFRTVNDPFIYLKNQVRKTIYSNLTDNQLKDIDFQIEHFAMQVFPSGNNDSVKDQVNQLSDIVSDMQRNLEWQQELTIREKQISSTLEQVSFRDQLIMPQSSTHGLLVFPPLRQGNTGTLFFTLPDQRLVSVSFMIQTSSN